MSNLEQKFKDWQERMSVKSEEEQHNIAISISLFLTAIVTFFVISSWYYRISGAKLENSFFTDIEETFSVQKKNFQNFTNSLNFEKENFQNIFQNSETVLRDSSSTTSP